MISLKIKKDILVLILHILTNPIYFIGIIILIWK